MIISVRYSSPDNIPINVEHDDGVVWSLSYYPPDNISITKEIQAFFDAGGSIDPYDEYYGWTLERAVAVKTDESETYAQSLITEAYANPISGQTENPVTYNRRVETRRKDKADKQAGDITLDQAEKDEAKSDQKLSEYEGKAWTSSDKVIKNIHKESTVNGVMGIDVQSSITWPVWTPPV